MKNGEIMDVLKYTIGSVPYINGWSIKDDNVAVYVTEWFHKQKFAAFEPMASFLCLELKHLHRI